MIYNPVLQCELRRCWKLVLRYWVQVERTLGVDNTQAYKKRELAVGLFFVHPKYWEKESFTMSENMCYSERLAKVVEILNVDSKQIALATGFSRSSVYSLISGRPKKPSDRFVSAMADEFGVSANWLLSGEGSVFLPGRFPVDFSGKVPTDELKTFEMVNFLIANLSLPSTCRAEVLEVAKNLIALREGVEIEAAVKVEKKVAQSRGTKVDVGQSGQGSSKSHRIDSCLEETDIPGKTVRLRKQYAKRKAKDLLQLQSIRIKATIKIKESQRIPADLTEHMLSEHNSLEAITNLELVDCVVSNVHRQTAQDDVFLVDATCQYDFTGTLKKESGTSEREFGVVVELSFCVLDHGKRFKTTHILRENVRFDSHDIFYAIDTELGSARKKNVSVSDTIELLEKKQKALLEEEAHVDILAAADEVAQMEECGGAFELEDTDEMVLIEVAYDTLYPERKETHASASA